MCGIAGYIRASGLFDDAMHRRVLAKLQHRGPDGDGIWQEPSRGLCLLHTRLKVQDLTPAADQPMRSDDGKVTLIFNGEIYNFLELREELMDDGAKFTSTGDTAVLLELCRRDPQLGFLKKLEGMFAFAVWHAPTQTLSVVRDRTGVKPLLFAELAGGGLAFASEMSALRPMVGSLAIDPMAVAQLLTLGFIAAPRTIFHQVRKLRPGHLFRYRQGRVEVEPWNPLPPTMSPVMEFDEAALLIRSAMEDAVAKRLIADVPVGVFLSGGIDSAIVTATAARVSDTRIKTFSVCFPDQPFYDESRYSKAVAEMYGTDHTVLPLSLDDVRGIISTVQDHISEPFADSSALPTYLLSRLTRQHVTVALSGDGADELFAGYNRYAATTLNRWLGWFAQTPLYRPVRNLLERLPVKREQRVGAKISMLKRAVRSMDPDLPRRYANWMRTSDDRTFARLLQDSSRAEPFLSAVVQLLWQYRGEPKQHNDLNNHLRTEWALSLPDDMLTKVDLMSMAHGLEVRSPFLDSTLVNLVFPMKAQWKLRGFRKKYLLIESFKNELPEILHNRPKKGFEVPVGPWLRGPLRPMAEELIRNDRCFFGKLLSREGALATLEEHASGKADHNFCLWALVSLLAWQQKHAEGIEVAE